MITAALVKELRDKTGAGMMDCKKALTECEGNLEAAVDWLREKGIAKAAKKAERIAAEGLCEVALDGNTAYVFELNAETDFVAKNEKFLKILEQISQICVENNCKTVEDILAATLEGQTGNDIIVAATATIGEKISLRRLAVVTKADDEVFGVYKHNGGKIVVLSVIKSQVSNAGSTKHTNAIPIHIIAPPSGIAVIIPKGPTSPHVPIPAPIGTFSS